MSSRGPNGVELLAGVTDRVAATGDSESLSDPGGDRHVLGLCGTLDFAILGILNDHLQAFGHLMSVIDSYR